MLTTMIDAKAFCFNKARKVLLLMLMCMLSVMSIHAQESPLVGTWEGTYTAHDPDKEEAEQFKLIIRIKQYDNEYVVKVKTCSIEDPSKAPLYWDDCNVIFSNESTIIWDSVNLNINSSDNTYKIDGQIVTCLEYHELCTVKYKTGRLLFEKNLYNLCKNREGNIFKDIKDYSWKVTLYKDEEGW